MGAGKLSLWRERRRRDAEANLRSVLHPALFAETRRHDRSENDLYDVCGKGPLNGPVFRQRSVISYRLSNCRAGAACRARNGKRERLPYNVRYQSRDRRQRHGRAWSSELRSRTAAS